MKTALLLWDNLTVLAPAPDFVPQYDDCQFQEAFEIIGRSHFPTDQEKQNAHELIEDFATRPLPKAFYYAHTNARDPRLRVAPFIRPEARMRNSAHCKIQFFAFPNAGVHEIYVQKFLPKTWDLLREAGLAGEENYDGDVRTPDATGLGLMSLLADCCAGEVLTRVTDQEAAYAAISSLFTTTGEDERNTASETERLATVALAAISLDNVPFQKLVDFRKHEEASANGYFIRDLRHRLLATLEAQITRIKNMKSRVDYEQLRREFESDMRDDLASLRVALRLEAAQVLGWKELWTAILASSGLAMVHSMPALSYSTAAGAIAGLLATRSKFVRTRQKILQEHPMAYLYELSGGLRL